MTRSILVVDDDPGLQLTIQSVLEDEGYAVTVAGDGIEALDVLSRQRPDAIVLEISMPRLDGYGVVEELSRRGLRPGLPVLVLTADGRAPEKAARMGAESYLGKPFSISALLAEVVRLAGLPDSASGN